MSRRWVIFASVLALALPPWLAMPSLTSTSMRSVPGTTTPVGRYVLVRYRCDNSGALTGDGPVGGETCAAGNWWPAVLGYGARAVTLSGLEYGTGSGEWSLWNCQDPVGSGPGELPTVSAPGFEDPASAPTPGDPDPLCTRINVDAAGLALPLNGTSTQEIHFSGQARTFSHLVVRTDACTGNCDASLALVLVW